MKKIYRVFLVLFSFATLLVCGGAATYASEINRNISAMEDDSVKTDENASKSSEDATANGETSSSEGTDNESEEVSDLQMVLVMFGGMVFMAAIVVLFAGINYRKTNLNEKSRNRDVF
ncbi:MAG: hypothetical protein K2M73_03110 [Lachnospiraceae bacterium]|nr:hypothetical protein [Lachnospiraceae bacterium]